MKTYLKSSLAALAVGLLAHAPAESAVVFTYQNGLSCGTLSSCSIGTNGNLSEPSQVYSTVAGFDSQFARGTAITVSLNGLPTHTTVGIDFLLAVIDSWDGLTGGFSPDIFEVKVDGTTVFSAGYDIFDAADQSPVRGTQLAYNVPLGFSSNWNDAAYDMASVAALQGIAHSASTMSVEFLFANSQGIDDESFAVENLRISVDSVSVPEPSAIALFGLALSGFAFARRKA